MSEETQKFRWGIDEKPQWFLELQIGKDYFPTPGNGMSLKNHERAYQGDWVCKDGDGKIFTKKNEK